MQFLALRSHGSMMMMMMMTMKGRLKGHKYMYEGVLIGMMIVA
jgi:hypothetical protein